MNTQMRIRAGAGALYALAILVSLLTGGLVWVAIIGAILLSLLYTSLRGGPGGAGRLRNRNRNR